MSFPQSPSEKSPQIASNRHDIVQHEGVAGSNPTTEVCTLPPACGILRPMTLLPNSGYVAALSPETSESQYQTQIMQAHHHCHYYNHHHSLPSANWPVLFEKPHGGIEVLYSQTSFIGGPEAEWHCHGDYSLPGSLSVNNNCSRRGVIRAQQQQQQQQQQHNPVVTSPTSSTNTTTAVGSNPTSSSSSSSSPSSPSSRSSVQKRSQTQQVLRRVDSEGIQTWRRLIVEYS